METFKLCHRAKWLWVFTASISWYRKKTKAAPHSWHPCQQTFDKKEISNAHTSPTGQSYSPKWLVCNVGLKVSVFPHSHTFQTQEVYALCPPWSGVRVQGPDVWACSIATTPPRGKNLQLPRRLAPLLQLKGGGLLPCHNGVVSSQEARLYCELFKK